MSYLGGQPPSPSGARTRYEYIAAEQQSAFGGVDINGNTLAYIPGFQDVIVDGHYIEPEDMVANNGTSITLSQPLSAGMRVLVLVPGTFSFADVVKKSGDTMAGPLVLHANPAVSLGAAPKQYVDTSFGAGILRTAQAFNVSLTFDFSASGARGETTVSDNFTLNFPTIPANAQAGVFYADLVNDSTAGRTMTLGAGLTLAPNHFYDDAALARNRIWFVLKSGTVADVYVDNLS
jgi:hypothetical protein